MPSCCGSEALTEVTDIVQALRSVSVFEIRRPQTVPSLVRDARFEGDGVLRCRGKAEVQRDTSNRGQRVLPRDESDLRAELGAEISGERQATSKTGLTVACSGIRAPCEYRPEAP